MEKLKQLYTECMNCKNNSSKCPNIKKDVKRGFPPRGFYFEKTKIDILVIGKNPGHLLENSDENKLYKNIKNNELFDTWMNFRKEYFLNHKNSKARSSRFHKNLYSYLEEFVGEDVFKSVAETNLIKCSTVGERDKLNLKTVNECYNLYLKNEINIYKPKVILALGREVEKYLNSRNGVDFNCKIIYIKHPSYNYKKEERKKILSDFKKEINTALKQ